MRLIKIGRRFLAATLGWGLAACIPARGEEIRWKPHVFSEAMQNRHGFSLTEFKGKVWAVGGSGCGTNTEACDQVGWTQDGVTWTLIQAPVDLASRSGHAAAVYNGEFYVVGGRSRTGALLGDVWKTSNGSTWTKLTTDGGYLAREGHALAVHGNRIWLTGGDPETGAYSNHMDVWSTYDGRNWMRENVSDMPMRRGHSMASHGGELWVVGGEIKQNSGTWVAAPDNWRRNSGYGHWSVVSYGSLDHMPTRKVFSFRGELWELGVETFPSTLPGLDTWRFFAYVRNGAGNWRQYSGTDYRSTTGYQPWRLDPYFEASPLGSQLFRVHPFLAFEQTHVTETYHSLTAEMPNGRVWFGGSYLSPFEKTRFYPAGSSGLLRAAPDEGYAFDHWSGDAQGAVPMELLLNRDMIVTAHYGPARPAITIVASGPGRASPAGSVLVTRGSPLTIQLRPDPGSRLARLTVDGTEVAPVASYTFLDVKDHHSLEATFEGCTLKRIAPGYVAIKAYPDEGAEPVTRYMVPDAFGALAQSQLEQPGQSFLVSTNIEDGVGYTIKGVKPYPYSLQDIPPGDRTQQPFQFEPMECEDVIRKANAFYDGSTPSRPQADGYAYSETRFETQPSAVVSALGWPGVRTSADADFGGHPRRIWSFGVTNAEGYLPVSSLTESALDSKEPEFGEYELTVVRDPNGNFSQQIEDLQGNVVTRWASPNLSDPAAGIVSKVEYDILDEVKTDIPPFGPGYQGEFVRTSAGDLLSEKTADAGTTEYRYDAHGRIRFAKSARQKAKDDPDHDLQNYLMFAYDDMNRLIAICDHAGSHPFDQPETPFVAGQGDSTFLKRNYFDTFTSEDLQALGFATSVGVIPTIIGELGMRPGRLAATVAYGRGGQKSADIFSYDNRGWLKATYRFLPGNLPVQKFEFDYDSEGKIIQENYYNGFDPSTGVWIPESNRGTEYDAISRVSRISIDGYPRFDYAYQENGALAGEKLYVPGQAQPLEEVGFEYTVQDWIKRVATSGAVPRFSVVLDHGNRFNGSLERVEYAYQLDPVDRRTRDYSFTYDGVDRLTRASTSSDPAYAMYAYDAQGRFTSKKEGAADLTAFEYLDHKNQVARIPGHPEKGISNAFVYDPDGNLVLDRSKRMAIDYDAMGQAVSFRVYQNLPTATLTWQDVENDGLRTRFGMTLVETSEMAYDASGQRVLKSEIDFSGSQPVAAFIAYVGGFAEFQSATGSGDWVLKAINHWTPTGMRGRREALDEYVYLTDQAGSIRMGINSAGTVMQATDYSPYGIPQPVSSSANGKARQGYTEKELDPVSRLTYFGARYLDAEVSIWTTPDPMQQYHNGYGFVGGDPVNHLDVWGLEGNDVPINDLGTIEDQYVFGKGPKQLSNPVLTICCSELPSGPGRPVPVSYSTDKHPGTKPEIGPITSDEYDKLIKASMAAMGSGPGAEGKAAVNTGRYLGRAGMSLGKKIASALGEAGSKAAAEGTEAAVAAAGGAAASKAAGGAGEKVAGSVRDVNPLGGKTNCVNCVIATHSTLSGAPASALLSEVTNLSVLEQMYGNVFSKVSGKPEIIAKMAEAGSGAQGVVFGSRGVGQTGHVFNAVNQKGVVRFLDGQTGKSASFEGYKELFFMPLP